MEKDLKEIMKIVEKKFEHLQQNKHKKINGINNKEWYSYEIYLEGLLNEIEEVKEELKKDNSVFLEDELGDILWVYLNLIYFLDKEGYIDHKNVFKRSLKKFKGRLEGIYSGITWGETKKKQKEELKKEHDLKYNKNKK